MNSNEIAAFTPQILELRGVMIDANVKVANSAASLVEMLANDDVIDRDDKVKAILAVYAAADMDYMNAHHELARLLGVPGAPDTDHWLK